MKRTYIFISVFTVIVIAVSAAVFVKILEKPVYMIIGITVLDKDGYSQYTQKAKPIVEKYKGRYIVRSNEVARITGGWNPERVVIIRFDNREHFSRCFNSNEYKKIAYLRESSTMSNAILVSGVK